MTDFKLTLYQKRLLSSALGPPDLPRKNGKHLVGSFGGNGLWFIPCDLKPSPPGTLMGIPIKETEKP